MDNLRLLCAPHNRLVAKQRFGREHVKRAIAERQRESALKRLGVAEGRSPRPSHDARATLERAELHDKLSSGLTRLGFKAKETKQALAQVFAQKDAAPSLPPIDELMREALRVLAPG